MLHTVVNKMRRSDRRVQRAEFPMTFFPRAHAGEKMLITRTSIIIIVVIVKAERFDLKEN